MVADPEVEAYLHTMLDKQGASLAKTCGEPENFLTVSGHEISLVHAAHERLNAVLTLINQAQSSIKMFTYMFSDDRSGNEVLTALINACGRGVAVQLIVDSFGSGKADNDFFNPLVNAGGHFHYFGSRWGIGYLIRNHQKMLLIDGETILIGGFNITDDYLEISGEESWEDFGAVISGPQVTKLTRYYDDLCDLSRDGKTAFLKIRKVINRWKPETGTIRWLLGGPTNRISPWALSLKNDLEDAANVDLVAAYFSPSQTILRRIAKVSRRSNVDDGTSVRLILAGHTDNGATIGAARLLYNYLLKRGVSIYEFRPRRLHMKLLVIDNACYIGSANLDIRSLFINMEIMVRIDDAALAKRLRQIMNDMMVNSIKQNLEGHRKRANWWRRTKWAFAYFLVNTVDYTIGRRIKFNLLRK